MSKLISFSFSKKAFLILILGGLFFSLTSWQAGKAKDIETWNDLGKGVFLCKDVEDCQQAFPDKDWRFITKSHPSVCKKDALPPEPLISWQEGNEVICNDELSSIRIIGLDSIRLWEDKDFHGKNICLIEGFHNLNQNFNGNFNDITTAVEINPAGCCTGDGCVTVPKKIYTEDDVYNGCTAEPKTEKGVYLFKEDNLEGAWRRITSEISDLCIPPYPSSDSSCPNGMRFCKDDGGANSIQSVLLRGVDVRFYDKPNLQGENICFRGSTEGYPIEDIEEYVKNRGWDGIESIEVLSLGDCKNPGEFMSERAGGWCPEAEGVPIWDKIGQYAKCIFLYIISFPVRLIGTGLSVILGIFAALASFSATSALAFMDYVVRNFMEASIVNARIVQNGWDITRTLANMMFGLVGVIIGLGTILRLSGFTAKKALPALIIGATLVNFSLVIVGVVVDIGNIVTYAFVRAYENVGGLKITFLEKFKAYFESIGGMWTATSIKDVMKLMEVHAGTGIFLAIYGVIAGIIFLAIALIFFLRTIVLWILAILAPLALAAYVLPATREMFRMWLNSLIQWAFVSVPLMFFLYLAAILDLAWVKGWTEVEIENLEGAALFFQSAVPLLILLLGITISLKFTPPLAREGLELTKKWGKWAAMTGAVAAGTAIGRRFGPEVKRIGERLEERGKKRPETKKEAILTGGMTGRLVMRELGRIMTMGGTRAAEIAEEEIKKRVTKEEQAASRSLSAATRRWKAGEARGKLLGGEEIKIGAILGALRLGKGKFEEFIEENKISREELERLANIAAKKYNKPELLQYDPSLSEDWQKAQIKIDQTQPEIDRKKAELEKERAKIKPEIEERKAKIKDEESKIKQIQSEIDEKKNAIAELNQLIPTLTGEEKRRARNRRNKLRRKIAELESELKTPTEIITRLKTEIAELEGKVTSLEKEVVDLDNQPEREEAKEIQRKMLKKIPISKIADMSEEFIKQNQKIIRESFNGPKMAEIAENFSRDIVKGIQNGINKMSIPEFEDLAKKNPGLVNWLLTNPGRSAGFGVPEAFEKYSAEATRRFIRQMHEEAEKDLGRREKAIRDSLSEISEEEERWAYILREYYSKRRSDESREILKKLFLEEKTGIPSIARIDKLIGDLEQKLEKLEATGQGQTKKAEKLRNEIYKKLKELSKEFPKRPKE